MPHPLLDARPGETRLLLGNEAIVRGALEAGVQVVTCYPGTPSSEVPDTFFAMLPDLGPRGVFFEYSVNEKVALEVAGGASLAGAMALATMKHVGVNVAADPLMTLAYIGTPGGLVLLSADDPGCHSSQNEQDNRAYARLAGMPVFEPASAQEAKDMTRDALLLSRELQQPVMLRTTTRLNHLRGAVTMGQLPETTPPAGFKRDPMRFVPVPMVARARHVELLKALDVMAAKSAASPWNRLTKGGGVGIIVSGISRAYLADAALDLDAQQSLTVLELGFSHPLPEAMVMEMLRSCDSVLVLEEGEPIVETEIRAMAQRQGMATWIAGKGYAGLSRLGEYSAGAVRMALAALLGKEAPEAPDDGCRLPNEPATELPKRPPNLCAGCPHRATYFAVRKVFGDEALYSSDIGCYTLGMLPPLAMADFLLCMGSSVSAGCGAAVANGLRGAKQPVVAFIGDSTFFHSGITGLVDAVFNRHDLLLVILDNRTTAMTGHQPNPGVDATRHGAPEVSVDIEQVVRGCGVTQVQSINPMNLKATQAALEEFKAGSGVRVLIASEACPLHARRLLGKKSGRVAHVAEQGDDARECLKTLACPAFAERDGEVDVDDEMCAGCMVCLQVAKGSVKAKAAKGSKEGA